MTNNNKSSFAKLAEEHQHFIDVAFSRNLGILTPKEQFMLTNARVAVPGLGGVGGLHCLTLARTGFGHFHLADPDNFELVNFNRQVGATLSHMGRSKLEVMSEEIKEINPHASVTSFPEGLRKANLDEFLNNIDVVVDGLDFFAFDIRRALFNRARQLGIPVVTAAPLGFSSSVLVFTPNSMPFDEYFAVHDGLDARECLLRFAVGLAPRGLHLGQIDPGRVSLDHGFGPSLGIACLLCAALAATETIRLITGRKGLRPSPCSIQIDALSGRSRRARPRRGNNSPVQRAKLWYVANVLLGGEQGGLRKPPPKPHPAPAAEVPPPGHLNWLARAAHQAPSGDNCQPWKFRIDAGKLHILLNPERDHSFFNVRQLASIIACGAATQNVISAAPGLGWTATPCLMPDPTDADCMATLTFAPWSGPADALGEAVWTRCTNRRKFHRRSVDCHDKEKLLATAGLTRLILLDNAPCIKELGRLLYLADRLRIERRDLHEHFMGMTHFPSNGGNSVGDGLPLGNLYAGAAGNAFLRLTRTWPAMRVANRLGLGKLVAAHSQKAMAASPLAGLVCAPSPTRRDFLEAGMGLERIWLTATRLGLAVQPMTAITLFWLRWKLDGPSAFSRQHQQLLEQVWTGFENLFPELGADCWPVMLFRAGHAPAVRHGTPRRELEAFVPSVTSSKLIDI